MSCGNSIIYENSIITLKVSESENQKIFSNRTDFTKPNEVWIDKFKQETTKNDYNIIPTNIINDITKCQFMFYDCNTITE